MSFLLANVFKQQLQQRPRTTSVKQRNPMKKTTLKRQYRLFQKKPLDLDLIGKNFISYIEEHEKFDTKLPKYKKKKSKKRRNSFKRIYNQTIPYNDIMRKRNIKI